MESQNELLPTDVLPQFEQREDKDWNRLAKEVAAWALYNFPRYEQRKPWLGLGEEAGELTHAVLKMQQGIRDRSEDDVKDALGDIGIFMSHLFGEFYSERDHEAGYWVHTPTEPNIACGLILVTAGRTIGFFETHQLEMAYAFARQLRAYAEALASYYGWDLKQITNEVWKTVQKRDWRTNSKNAHESVK